MLQPSYLSLTVQLHVIISWPSKNVLHHDGILSLHQAKGNVHEASAVRGFQPCTFLSVFWQPSLSASNTLEQPWSLKRDLFHFQRMHAGATLLQRNHQPLPQPRSLSAALLEAQLTLLGSLLAVVSQPNQLQVCLHLQVSLTDIQLPRKLREDVCIPVHVMLVTCHTTCISRQRHQLHLTGRVVAHEGHCCQCRTGRCLKGRLVMVLDGSVTLSG